MNAKTTLSEKLFSLMNYILLTIIFVITLYPFIYILSMSVSSPEAVSRQEVFLFPKGFSLDTYKMVFESPGIWQSFYNTVWYTIVGTLFNIVLTIIGAYPLSRKEFFARRFFMIFIAITMFFSGGLIPLFILVNNLGLYNTRWAIILPSAINAWYLIIARVFFQSTIPDSLPEAAKIDGCNDIKILYKVVLPLSAPIIAVVALFTAVGFWNNYFSPLIFLPEAKLQPLTILLQKILVQNDIMSSGMLGEGYAAQMKYAMQIKYSLIVVTILPIVCIYPFLQKYFVKGVMIGAIKE